MAKRLMGLMAAQFFGVFCEYACKIMVFTLATRPLFSYGEPGLIALLSLLAFLIPKTLFSFPAGILADRFSKRSVMVATKALEAATLLLGALFLAIAPHHIAPPFLLLALLGMQSALFNPAKSGIIPDLVSLNEISKSNGLLEIAGMAAIFLGTALGPLFLFADCRGSLPHLSCLGPLALALISLLGLASALAIPKIEHKPKGTYPLLNGWKCIFSTRPLLFLVLGTALYWTMMSFISQTVLVAAKTIVSQEAYQGIPLGCYWLGIALGAFIAGFSGSHLRNGALACIAALAILLFHFSLPLLILLGLGAGMMLVPLQALLQIRAPAESRGSIIAASNILNIQGILLGSFLSYLS